MQAEQGRTWVAGVMCLAMLMMTAAKAPAAENVEAAGTLPVIERYVAPDGKPDGTGEKNDPWDLASTLDGKRPIGPGYVIWVRGGTYKDPRRDPATPSGFRVNMVGSEERPILVRGCKGERATIDGGLQVKDPSADVWFQDLEILVSENLTLPRVFPTADRLRTSGRPAGGIYAVGGTRCKFINLVIHHVTDTGMWLPESGLDTEAHGCILYDNGWNSAEDRWRGGAISLRNNTGVKQITDNILFNIYDTGITAYGTQRAYASHIRAIGNTVISNMPGMMGFFMFSVERPMEDIVVRENVVLGLSLYVQGTDGSKGYTVERNIVVNGRCYVRPVPECSNKDNRLVPPGARPNEPECILRPNKYDKDRANLTIVNWTKAPSVNVDLSSFLIPGDRFRIQDARDFYGKPLVAGEFTGEPVAVGIAPCPASTADFSEVAAFVLLRDATGGVMRLYQAADKAHALGKESDAVARFNEVAEKYPDSVLAPLALYRAAAIYEQGLNDKKSAAEIRQRLVPLQEKRAAANPWELPQLGETYAAAGYPEKAVVAYRKFLTGEMPANPASLRARLAAQYQIGALLEKLGKAAEAIEAYKTAAAMPGDDESSTKMKDEAKKKADALAAAAPK